MSLLQVTTIRNSTPAPARSTCCVQEYNLNVSLLQVTIIRNLAIVLLITHVRGGGMCMWWWLMGGCRGGSVLHITHARRGR